MTLLMADLPDPNFRAENDSIHASSGSVKNMTKFKRWWSKKVDDDDDVDDLIAYSSPAHTCCMYGCKSLSGIDISDAWRYAVIPSVTDKVRHDTPSITERNAVAMEWRSTFSWYFAVCVWLLVCTGASHGIGFFFFTGETGAKSVRRSSSTTAER